MILTPAASWDVQGVSADPAQWLYTIEIAVPSAMITRVVTGAQVLHPRYAERPGAPWKGVGPLGVAANTEKLAAWLEVALAEEVHTTHGNLLALPDGIAQTKATGVSNSLKDLKGKLFVAETTAAAWGAGKDSAPRKDWEATRLGADPPRALGELRDGAQATILAAFGVPLGLVESEAASSLREQWRLTHHGTIVPLGKIMAGGIRLEAGHPRPGH